MTHPTRLELDTRTEALIAEIERYLGAVEVFRELGQSRAGGPRGRRRS